MTMTIRKCLVCEMPADRFCDEGQHETCCSKRCEKAWDLAYSIVGEDEDNRVCCLANAIRSNDPRLRMPEGA